jgi:hypothetical protein
MELFRNSGTPVYSFKCVKFFIKDRLIYLFFVNNINVSYAKVVNSNLTLSADGPR